MFNPTTDSFYYAIRAWTRCRTHPQMPQMVMKWLCNMELYAHTQNTNNTNTTNNTTTNTTNNNELLVKPNTACYCIVMDAWAVRAGIIAKQQYYNNNQHNNNNNNNKKNSSSTSSIDETMDKVRGIFQYIKDIHNANAAASNDDNVKPDTAAYTILLSAYANIVYSIYNKDIPYQCEQIFYEMKEHHNSIIPDERTYYYIIQPWIKVQKPKCAEW